MSWTRDWRFELGTQDLRLLPWLPSELVLPVRRLPFSAVVWAFGASQVSEVLILNMANVPRACC